MTGEAGEAGVICLMKYPPARRRPYKAMICRCFYFDDLGVVGKANLAFVNDLGVAGEAGGTTVICLMKYPPARRRGGSRTAPTIQ